MVSKNNNNKDDEWYDHVNRAMVKYFPELTSDYARYPMTGRRRWLDIARDKVGPKGDPLFVARLSPQVFEGRAVRVKDYVYGHGPLGCGYYSLLTKESYVVLARDFNEDERSRQSWGEKIRRIFSRRARREYDLWDLAGYVVFMRAHSSHPDDDFTTVNSRMASF